VNFGLIKTDRVVARTHNIKIAAICFCWATEVFESVKQKM
jgi:hypothetical protein